MYISTGMMEVTLLLKSWIITGGTNSGIMKYVGEARAKYNPTVPLIGITPLGIFRGCTTIIDKLRSMDPNNVQTGTMNPINVNTKSQRSKSFSPYSFSSSKRGREGSSNNKITAAVDSEELPKLSYDEMSKKQEEIPGDKFTPAVLDSNHSHFIFTHSGSQTGLDKVNFGTETKTRADFETCMAANFMPHRILNEKSEVVGFIRPYQTGAPGREMEEYIWQTMQQANVEWDMLGFKSTSSPGIPLVSICVQGIYIYICVHMYSHSSTCSWACPSSV